MLQLPVIQETDKMSGVYQLLNTVNGRSYVGSTKNLRARLAGHIRHLDSGCHCNVKLQRAWCKYGREAWKIHVLEFCSLNELIQKERNWVQKIDSIAHGYNLNEPGKAHYPKRNYRRVLSEETKHKISMALKGRKIENTPARIASFEVQRTRPHRRGWKHSEETKRKISKANSKPKPVGFGITMSKALLGKTLSGETRKKISSKMMGNTNQLGKIRIYNPLTQESRTVFSEVAQPLFASGWLKGMPKRT